MKILCVTYRDWARNIYRKLKQNKKKKQKFYFYYSKKGLNKKIKNINPDYILFYGWSWFINKKIFAKYNCFMLHPSPLPKFRGGSPIQNQIIRGKKISAVTIFKINKIIDGGDIYFQKKFSLNGTLHQIFERIVKLGIEGTKKILSQKKIRVKKQNHSKSTYFRRRSPKESEITMHEIKNKSAEYILSKIRMLDDPYPNAFIKVKNKKILIKKATIE